MIRYFLLLFLVCNQTLVDAQVNDDFSDGDFTSNPAWNGTASNFIVNASNRLQIEDDEAAQSWLSTGFAPETLNAKEWNFWAKHSFSGSTNNFTRIYLSSNQENLSFTGGSSAGAEGYFLLLGEAGSEDAIRLFRDDLTGDAPTEILVGSLGLVAGSFEIGIRVVRDDLGNWTLFTDPDGGTTYQLEATGFDDTYTTSSYVGFTCTYTISNATNFQFDDLYFGDQFVDEEAPEVQNLIVIDQSSLDLQFNEPLDQTSAENILNYSVSAGVSNPDNATLDIDPTLVHLTFSSIFTSEVELNISVSGVQDLAGNPSVSQDLSFTYFDLQIAEAGNVVFNELLPDPSPALGLPEFEFVELHNHTNAAFDLGGWEFINSTTSKVLPQFVLSPGAFVLLCDEEEMDQFTSYGDVIGIPSFTALSNAGDSLTLLNATDEVIDIVAYSDDWYGPDFIGDGGVTLERVNPEAGCSGIGNWTASTSFQGGTPGAQNSTFDTSPDTEIPLLISSEITSETTALISFNETLALGLDGTEGVTITPDLGFINALFANNASALVLFFDQPFEPGITYSLSLSGIEDCSGNAVIGTVDLDLTQGFAPEVGDLRITEIMADADAELPSPNSEYVEILNTSDHIIELTNVKLNDGEFMGQVLIEAGAYLILTSENNLLDFLLYPNKVGITGFPGLTNGGRTLLLLNADEEVLDEVSYALSWYNDLEKQEGGFSLELINLEDPCSDQDNWTASIAAQGATAGSVNSVLSTDPDALAPRVLYALVAGPDALELFFDEQLDELTEDVLETEILIQQGNVVLELAYTQLEVNLVNPDRRSLIVFYDGGFSTGTIYLCSVNGATDCWGNVSGSSNLVQFAVPEEAEAGDLIINEILSNPYDGSDDFIEIYNRSLKNISIEGWQLGNEENGIPDNFEPISEEQFVLFPGEYLVLTESALGITSFYAAAQSDRVLEVNNLPTYSNADGVVVLTDSVFNISDRVAYTDDWHYPLLDDDDGVSFERLNPNRSSDDATNWHSASTVSGYATPGYLNSQFSESMTSAEVSASPAVFSPDNDGFEDNCLISYTMSREGYAGSFTIYDDEGRQVRKLVQNDLLGISGAYAWNGIGDDNRKNPIGIYIIYFEAFHPDGEVIERKITCVLGHQLN
ncbi:MAG: hypothetical protein ACJAU0_000485 [Flavobacteriales bacterium]|jgi:hypothetical protein